MFSSGGKGLGGEECVDVAVVGAGLAGLSAAELLASNGLSVLVLDENPYTGGQLLRISAGKKRLFEPDRIKRRGFGLIGRVRRSGAEILQGVRVLGLFPDRELLVERGGHAFEVRADAVLLATGARETFLPFPGWTLPGVISTGAAQILMKSDGILPAREMLIAGTSPLMLPVAGEAIRNGGRVRAVLDGTGFRRKLSLLPGLLRYPERLFEGLWHGTRLLRAGVPVRQGVRVVEARGASRLESVLAAKTDEEGRPVAGTETVHRVDCLAVGDGFAPNTELAQAAGCGMARDGGGWVVQVDDGMEATLDGVFAAGEITGVAGGKKSFIEGRMAGWSILRRRGEITESEYESRMMPPRRERARQLAWGRFLHDLCQVPDGAWRSIPDETIICRCEDVTAGELRRKMAEGFDTFGALKKATRCGMGMCQGRTCGPILMEMVRAWGDRVSMPEGPVPVRAPVKPVRLSALIVKETP